MANTKYVPNRNVIQDKRKKKPEEENKKKGYRYDSTGKKITSSSPSKKNTSSDTSTNNTSYIKKNEGVASTTTPSTPKKVRTTDDFLPQISQPTTPVQYGPVAQETAVNTPVFQPSQADIDQWLDWYYKQIAPTDQQIMQGVGNMPNKDIGSRAYDESVTKGATLFGELQAPTVYHQNLIKAAAGDTSVLDDRDKVIADLKAQKGVKRADIRAAKNQFNDYEAMLRYSGYQSVDAAMNSGNAYDTRAKNIIDKQFGYSRDQLEDDLLTMQEYALTGINSGESFDAVNGRLSEYFGRNAYEDAVNDPGGWMQKYMDDYDAGSAYAEQFISANSGVAGTDADFGLDSYMQHMQAIANEEEAETKLKEYHDGRKATHEDLASNSDYAINSQYMQGGSHYTPEDLDNGIFESSDRGSQLNDLVHASADLSTFDQVAEAINNLPNNAGVEIASYASSIRYMTEEDRADFFYIYNTQGYDAAKAFLDNELAWNLDRQYEDNKAAAIKADIEEHPMMAVVYNLLSYGSGMLNALGGAANLGGFASGNGNQNEYSSLFTHGRTKDTITNATYDMIAGKWSDAEIAGINVPGMLYNAVYSAGNSAINTALFGHAATAVMALDTYNSSLRQNLEKDGDFTSAQIDAIFDGVVEAATEYFSVENLLDDTATTGFKALLKQAGTEMSEEEIGLLVRTAYDNIKYDTIKNEIASLRAQGYSEQDAARTVGADLGREILETGITSAISGGMGGAKGAIQQGIANTQTGKQFRNNADLADFETLLSLSDGVPLTKAQKKLRDQLRAEIEAKKAGLQQEQATVSEKETVPEQESAEVPAEQANQQEAKKGVVEKPGYVPPMPVFDRNKAVSDAGTGDAQTKQTTEQEQAQEREQETEQETEQQAQEIAEEVQENPEANAQEAANNITNTAGKSGGAKTTAAAKVGLLYRATMQHLDEAAQNALRDRMSFNIAKELGKKGVAKTEARTLATSILRMQDGTFTPEDQEALKNNAAARNVLMEYTAKVEAEEAAADKVNQLGQTIMPKNKPSSTKVYADEGEDEFDAVEAEVQAKVDGIQRSEGDSSTVDGEEVKIVGVEPPKDANSSDSVMLKVVSGDGVERTVAADDIAYSEADEPVFALAQYAAQYGAQADAVFAGYQAGQDVNAYARAFDAAYRYGVDGRNLDVLKNSGKVNALTDGALKAAYNFGRDQRIAASKAQQAVRSQKGAGVAGGNLDTSGINMDRLNAHQKKSVKAMGALAKVLGINVRVVESKANAKGYYTDDNGTWNSKTRTLTLDIHAGSNSITSTKYAMMDTAGHELTHFIRDLADNDLWNDYQEFVLNHLDTKMDLEREINRFLSDKRNAGKSRDYAIEEIIADASVKALSKITDQQISELAESNPTLFKKIANYIKKWISNFRKQIRKAFASSEGEANRFAQAMEDQLDEMAAKWNKLLVNATKNANASVVPGVEVDTETDTATIKNSLRSLQDSEYATNPDKMAKALAKAVNVSEAQAKRYIRNMFSIGKIIAGDQTRLDYEGNPLNSVLKDNAEYKFTVDMSTLCAKRLIYTGTLDAIQKAMPNTVLTSEDLCALREMMMDRDYEVACGICYVESRRRELGSITKGFVDAYNDALAKGEDMMLGAKNNKQAFPTEGGNMLTLADVNTTEGIENIQRNHPKIYAAYMKYMNSSGVSKPKLIETRTDYRGEILDLFNSKVAVKNRNDNGGLRIQSFSDFEVVHLIDMMQVITDMAQVGLAGQAYTKVPNFAEAMGRTGLKINLSLIAKGDGIDANGNLIFDDIEGMPAEDAFRLRKKYSKNVGTILVGKSDAHIRAALNDPRIDFVIPFHKSGWSENLYAKLGLSNYTDYTNFQNERAVTDPDFKWDHSKSAKENYAAINKIRDKSRSVDNLQPIKDYWDFSLSGEENAQNYLEACYYDGRLPKFPQFANEPGYWKLLIDFKMYDNNGVGSPQNPVKPDFNMTQARRMLKEYNGGHTKLPVAQDVVDDFVKQYQGGEDVKHSARNLDAEYEKAYEELDESRARKLVREAAIAAGYNPLKLYHGTTSFGFTKVDPSKSDDGISFFATDNDLVAETYAGEDARIKTIGSMDGMTVDKLMAMEGEPLLRLLHRYGDDEYQLVSNDEIRELVNDEGELIRKRVIPEVERRINNLREEFNDFSMNPERENAIIKAYEAVVDALDRLSYAKYYELANNLYIAYDDALRELRKLDESEASLHSYSVGNDIHSRYYSMLNYLSGDLFKVEGEWSTEYITRSQAIDTLLPRMFKGIYELYGKTDNLFEVDAKGSSWRHIEGSLIGRGGFVSTRDVAAYAKANGFDGVHFKNIIDVGGMANYVGESDVYTFFNPGDIKSADTFTYDDNMDLIPLSERFKREDDDIRYSIRETTDGRKVVAVEDDILRGIYDGGNWTTEQKSRAKKAARKALESAGPIYGGGIPIYINADTRKEFPSSNYVRKTLAKNGQMLADRYRIASGAKDMLIAVPNFERDPKMKPRDDFVRFMKGSVYMSVLGRNYEAVVKIGVKTNGGYVLYDLVDMKEASFKLKKEGISSTAQAKKAIAMSSEIPSNGDTIAQEGSDVKSQMRDPYNVSDRELLADALESLTTNADELYVLRTYQSKVEALNKRQIQLEETEERLKELKAGDPKANRDEIIKLTNNVKTLTNSISRMDSKLLELEALAHVKKLADRQREQYKAKLDAQTDERIRKYKERQKTATQKKIAEVRVREAAKRDALRERLKNEGDARYQKLVNREAERRERMKNEYERKVNRLEDRLEAKDESHSREKYRARILEDVKKLHSWVSTPTNKGYVPDFLKKPLGDFIQSIDFSSARSLKGGDPTKGDARMLSALDDLRRALANAHNQTSLDQGAASFAGYIDLPAEYLQRFDDLVGAIKKTLDASDSVTETPFMKMTSAELRDLSEMIRILKSSVLSMNRLIVNGRYESAKTASNDTISDMDSMKARVKMNNLLAKVNSMFNWKNTTPYYAFQRLGRGGKAIFEALQNGWDKLAYNSAKLIEYANATFTAKQAKAWSGDIKTVKLDSGESVQITAAQLMSLYCLNKRAQAVGHLLGGGIRVSDITKRGSTISQTENYTLTQTDIERMIGMLTAEQKGVADKLQRFMNTTLTEWGNEISMKRFGYKMFTESNYFPIETDANNRSKIDDKDNKNSMFRLLNMSALKPLTQGANNAIVISDIFDVFSNHASDIAKYNALALPILDFIKWYNYVEKSEVTDANGNKTGQITTRSTQKALERMFGQDAKQYVMNFIKDINAEHDGGRNDTILAKLMGNAKAASVGANLRVYFLQITSLPRAAYAISPKYLAKGLAKVKSLNPVNAIKGTEAQEKIGILKWKNLGFYNTDVARSVRSMVRRDDGVMSKIRDIAMKPAEWGDNWVSNIIYEAAKAEMADKHPNFQPGTKAYDMKLNQRVREIVYKTQVVDSTMTRSDFMRSKGLMSAFTAFMSEPTLTVNMLNESIQEAVANARSGMNARENLRNVGGKAVKAALTFAVTAAFSALVESLFDAMRDDDDYEEFEEKFSEAFGGNVVDNMNVAGMLPILKDVISLMQGYENNSMVTQAAEQFIDTKDAIIAWQEGKRPLYSVIYNAAKAAGSSSGVGIQNVMRDFVGLYNTFCADAWNQPKIQTYSDNKTDAATAYYEAVRDGDTEAADWVLSRAAVNGYSEEDFRSKMKTLIKAEYLEGELDYDTATEYLVTYAGSKDANDAYWLIKGWDNPGEDGFSKYGELRSAIIAGGESDAIAAYEELAQHGTKEETIASQITELYNSGEATTILNLQLRSDRLYTSNQKLKADGQVYKDDFDAFITAIVNGIGIENEVSKLRKRGYTTKQIMNAINGAFGNDGKRYMTMVKYNQREAAILLDRILDAYEAIGLKRNDEIEWIEENWKMPE